MNKLIFNKVFFGKNTAFKILLNDECYFHIGLKHSEDAWVWQKVKMNDVELGEIICVLQGVKKSVSFYHSFKEDSNKIWVFGGDGFTIKINNVSRSFTQGEQKVLEELLKYCILRTNLLL